MAHNAMVFYETAADDTERDIVIFGLIEALLLQCRDLNCRIAPIESDESNPNLERAVIRTLEKSKDAAETPGVTLSAYFLKECLLFGATVERPELKLHGAFTAIRYGPKLVGFNWTPVQAQAVPKAVAVEFMDVCTRILNPNLAGSYPDEIRAGDRLGTAVSSAMDEVSRLFNEVRKPAELN